MFCADWLGLGWRPAVDECHQGLRRVSGTLWPMYHRHAHLHVQLSLVDAHFRIVRHIFCLKLLLHTYHPRPTHSPREVHHCLRLSAVVPGYRQPPWPSISW